MLEFRILGPVTMMRDGRPVDVPQQARTVLAQLLLAEERAVSTDRLMDAVWGERVPSSARAAMHNLVAALRRALGEDADMLTTQPPGYALRYGSRATFDLQAFEAEIDNGRRALESANPGQAEAMLSTALARWQGDALADLAYESWATPVAERLEELRLAAAELRIEAMLALGQSTKAIGEIRSLLVAHPLRESLHAQLLRGLMSAGRRSEALDAYRDWYGLTTSDLGLEPSRELRDLQRSLLEDDPSPPRGRHSRSVLLAASSPTGLRRILGLASALGGGETGHELILLLTTDPVERGVTADQALHAAGAELSEIADGLLARSATIVSSETIVGALRIARHQDVDLVLVDGHGVYPAEFPSGPCNVAVLASWPYADGRTLTGPVLVPFGGADDEWSALEIAAWLARANGVPLLISGAQRDGEDPSGMLATAALLVQRYAGAKTLSILSEPGADGVVRAAAGAGLVILSAERAGSDTVREDIVSRSPAPVMLVRDGMRPSGLAPADTITRFSWSMRAS